MKKASYWFVLSFLLILSSIGLAGATGDLGSWCLAQGQMWEGSHGRCLIGPGGAATVSEPLTIGKQQSIDIFQNGRLTNHSQIINDGFILNGGRIDSSGAIESDGYILNDGLFVSNGSVNHHGSFLNRSILNIDNQPAREFAANGPLINQGAMIISGTLTIGHSGSLSNRGAISNVGTIAVRETTIFNGNSILNDGLIQLTFASLLNKGTVANDGVINNDDSTIYNLCQGVISGTQPVGGVVVLLENCLYLPLVSNG